MRQHETESNKLVILLFKTKAWNWIGAITVKDRLSKEVKTNNNIHKKTLAN